MDSRCFKNEFAEYDGQRLLDENGKIEKDFREKLWTSISRLRKQLIDGIKRENSGSSVYTGSGGYALLDIHLHKNFENSDDLITNAYRNMCELVHDLKNKRVTFLCGDSGTLAVGAVLAHMKKENDDMQVLVSRLVDMHQAVCEDKSLPDECLYGRVGYLYSLLFVRKNIKKDVIDSTVIQKVFKAVIMSGQHLASKSKTKHPLMYAWHDKYYLGAAHGLAGILFMLMQAGEDDEILQPDLRKFVQPSIDYMLSLQFASGNTPSSLESSSGDKLVHWCHGAPGWVHMFVKAYKVFSDTKYLDAARKCGEVVWQRGLLKKGHGICHGAAGNAYTFLVLYNVTMEKKYLYRAMKFAEWCCEHDFFDIRVPDSPYSLFEGLAGTIYFLVDMLDPCHAKFPAYEL